MVISLKIPIEGGYVYYHDVLFSLYRHVYGRFRMKSQDKDQAKILKRQEKRIMNRISKIKEKAQKLTKDKSQQDFYYKKDNDYLSRMFGIRKIFRAWANWVTRKKYT